MDEHQSLYESCWKCHRIPITSSSDDLTPGDEPAEAWQRRNWCCQDSTCLQMPMAQGQALDVVSPEKPVDHKTDRIEFGKGCQTTIRNCIKHHQTTLHQRFLDDCIRTWSLPERARKDVVDLNQSQQKIAKHTFFCSCFSGTRNVDSSS